MTDLSILPKDELEKRKLIAEIEKSGAEVEKLHAERDKATQDAIFGARMNREKDAEHGQHRTFTFYDNVKQQSVAKAMQEIGVMSRRDPGQEIKVVLNSPGGSVLDGLALFDYLQVLRHEGHHIEVVALGMAASMGGVLLQAGDVRSMGKNAWLLIHEVSSGAVGNVSELEDELEFIKKLQDNIVTLLAERSNMSERQIKAKWKKKDWWMPAEEALKLGFIDQIV